MHKWVFYLLWLFFIIPVCGLAASPSDSTANSTVVILQTESKEGAPPNSPTTVSNERLIRKLQVKKFGLGAKAFVTRLVGYPIFTVGGIGTLVSGVYFTFTGEDDEESGSSVEIINNSSSNSSVDGYMAVTGLGGIALLVLGDHLLQFANNATGEKNKLNQKIELLKKDSVANSTITQRN